MSHCTSKAYSKYFSCVSYKLGRNQGFTSLELSSSNFILWLTEFTEGPSCRITTMDIICHTLTYREGAFQFQGPWKLQPQEPSCIQLKLNTEALVTCTLEIHYHRYALVLLSIVIAFMFNQTQGHSSL